ncbi:adhesin protein Mad2 [Emericellopsis atlantica]|uniref:Adhesin protein Mad2 n=1 Tax=Emericellopsis atlantica TaxID=2614577 RepID=A0A9P7ZUV0_9HYPO|nr:adhesin protein Mad2 [Emericellopsis atlantica]KAG9258655.1 adhesin protein Mad2 [Emericellopsis atlantica]
MKTTFALLGAASTATALLNLDVNLPLGISADLNLFGPQQEPCHECTNVWHPPHDGVIIDDCDNTHEHGWHWVHPCPEPNEPSFTWGTVTATRTNIITQCDVCAEPTTVTYVEETTVGPVPVETPAVPTTTVVVPVVPTTTTDPAMVPTTVPEVVQPSETMPPTQGFPSASSSSTRMEMPPSTFTSIYQTNTVPAPPAQSTPMVPGVPGTPVVPGTPGLPATPGLPVTPVAPGPPAENTPIVPGPTTTYGNNATNPIVTPPIVTPPPAAGAAQNTVGLALVAALAFALW